MRRALVLALGLLACSAPPAPPPAPGLRGPAADLRRVLERLLVMEETPLARWAGQAMRAVSGCEGFELSIDPAAEAPSLPTCRPAPATAGLGLDLDLPGGRVTGQATVSLDGEVRLDAELTPSGDGKAGLALVLPVEEPAGRHHLQLGDAVVYGRLRTESGLNLARLVAEGGQLAKQFGLKAELFAGAVLDNAFEFAVYPPRPGEASPRTAVALDTRSRAVAVEAMDGFLDQLASQWPIVRSPAAFGGRPGVCAKNLEILPALAPCYLATEDALIFGWNPASLAHAVGEGPRPDERAGGRLVVALARLPAVDAALTTARFVEIPLPTDAYPWSSLELRADRVGPKVKISLALTGPIARPIGAGAPQP